MRNRSKKKQLDPLKDPDPYRGNPSSFILALADLSISRLVSRNFMCRVALRYAEIGWRVFPVRQDKTPMLKGGCHAGTTDRKQIKLWWHINSGDMAVGISTGPESGIWVMDIDPRHGGDQSLATLVAKHGQLPKTLIASTPSGGRHYYFKYPEQVTITSSAGKIGPGIDHRGRNGYVVAPFSKVPHGKYEWITPIMDPVLAPPWLECFTLPKAKRPDSLFPCGHCGLQHWRERLH